MIISQKKIFLNLKKSIRKKNYKLKAGASLTEKPQPLTREFFETFNALLNNLANDQSYKELDKLIEQILLADLSSLGTLNQSTLSDIFLNLSKLKSREDKLQLLSNKISQQV